MLRDFEAAVLKSNVWTFTRIRFVCHFVSCKLAKDSRAIPAVSLFLGSEAEIYVDILFPRFLPHVSVSDLHT